MLYLLPKYSCTYLNEKGLAGETRPIKCCENVFFVIGAFVCIMLLLSNGIDGNQGYADYNLPA